MTDLDREFERETRNIKTGTPDWWAIRFKYDIKRAGERKEYDYRNAIVTSTVRKCLEIKKLQVSSFSNIKTERLVKIGAAMAVLYEELQKDNLIQISHNIATTKQ